MLFPLVACTPAGPETGAAARPTETIARVPGLSLQPMARGLGVVGSGGREISFGRDLPGVLDSVTRVEGRRPTPVTACDTAGVSGYATATGLLLVFRGQSFAGWQMEDAQAGVRCY